MTIDQQMDISPFYNLTLSLVGNLAGSFLLVKFSQNIYSKFKILEVLNCQKWEKNQVTIARFLYFGFQCVAQNIEGQLETYT